MYLYLILLIILFGYDAKSQPENKKRFNVLFLMSDQHRGDYMRVAGADWIKTPNLDQLASEGVTFNNAYSSVPSCFPARTSILTGMSPWASGQLGYTPIPVYEHEMPQIFTDGGYRTHAIGKNHFTPMRNKRGYQTVELEEAWYTTRKGQEKCDYTLWFEENAPDKDLNASGLHYTDHRSGLFPFEDKYHPTYWTAERAIQFLKTYEGEDSWFLKVSFQRPHPPFDPPKRWVEQYDNVDIPLPNVGSWAVEKYGNKTGTLKETNNATSGNFPLDEVIASRKSYAAAISFVDEQLGRVLDQLKERGELEKTIILYTVDHGDMMGDHYMWRKCRPYEGSARIPMIVRWPEELKLNAKRGQKRDELVELRDVLPTFMDVAGMKKHKAMDGESMLDILRGKPWRKLLDLEHAQIYEKDNAWVALTDGRYKYIYFTLTGQHQLFDLKKDPREMVDLASMENNEKSAKLLDSWRGKMINHLKVRGEEWVENGKLVIQEKPIYFGKNHPKFRKENNSN